MENNLIVQKNKDCVMIKKRPPLRVGQKALYLLFCSSLKLGRTVERKEMFDIYKKHVATGKSVVCRYDRVSERTVWVSEPWCDWQWDTNFQMWFTHTLGSLLKKGYLKLVPSIDLSNEDENLISNNLE